MSSRFTPLPVGFVPPCLPTGSKAPPTGKEWLHEIKHDGFQVIRSEALCASISLVGWDLGPEPPDLLLGIVAEVEVHWGLLGVAERRADDDLGFGVLEPDQLVDHVV
jgi:hypothetical protein